MMLMPATIAIHQAVEFADVPCRATSGFRVAISSASRATEGLYDRSYPQ
jgi:hypothetical protein